MGLTDGAIDGPFNSTAAIAFQLGDEFASRIVDTANYGTVIYAAVRSPDHKRVFGLVLLAERRGGVLYTMPISEEMGPTEDRCPERILEQLTDPPNDRARDWRHRCRTRLGRSEPKPGQLVIFHKPVRFLDGTEHRRLTFLGGSRFRSKEGAVYHVMSWMELDYKVRDSPSSDRGLSDTADTPEALVRHRRRPDARAANVAARRHQLARREAP